jgi:hypothetical protein
MHADVKLTCLRYRRENLRENVDEFEIVESPEIPIHQRQLPSLIYIPDAELKAFQIFVELTRPICKPVA